MSGLHSNSSMETTMRRHDESAANGAGHHVSARLRVNPGMSLLQAPLPLELFAAEPPSLDLEPLVAQGRIVDTVVSRGTLRGQPSDLARRLGIQSTDLNAAVQELVAVGWLAVAYGQDGELVICWADEPN